MTIFHSFLVLLGIRIEQIDIFCHFCILIWFEIVAFPCDRSTIRHNILWVSNRHSRQIVAFLVILFLSQGRPLTCWDISPLLLCLLTRGRLTYYTLYLIVVLSICGICLKLARIWLLIHWFNGLLGLELAFTKNICLICKFVIFVAEELRIILFLANHFDCVTFV